MCASPERKFASDQEQNQEPTPEEQHSFFYGEPLKELPFRELQVGDTIYMQERRGDEVVSAGGFEVYDKSEQLIYLRQFGSNIEYNLDIDTVWEYGNKEFIVFHGPANDKGPEGRGGADSSRKGESEKGKEGGENYGERETLTPEEISHLVKEGDFINIEMEGGVGFSFRVEEVSSQGVVVHLCLREEDIHVEGWRGKFLFDLNCRKGEEHISKIEISPAPRKDAFFGEEEKESKKQKAAFEMPPLEKEASYRVFSDSDRLLAVFRVIEAGEGQGGITIEVSEPPDIGQISSDQLSEIFPRIGRVEKKVAPQQTEEEVSLEGVKKAAKRMGLSLKGLESEENPLEVIKSKWRELLKEEHSDKNRDRNNMIAEKRLKELDQRVRGLQEDYKILRNYFER